MPRFLFYAQKGLIFLHKTCTVKDTFFTLIVFALIFCNSANTYSQAGSLDSSFGNYGKVTTYDEYLTSEDNVAVQKNGKIVISGEYLNSQFNFNVAMIRYNADGTLDSNFGNNGMAKKEFPQGISTVFASCPFVLLPDETLIVAACPFNNEGLTDIALTKFTAKGIIDSSFSKNGTVTTSKQGYSFNVKGMTLQKDGKIVIGGFVGYQEQSRFLIIRYNADGTLDTTFNSTGFFVSPGIDGLLTFEDIAVQSDGKIVALGNTFSGESLVLFRLTKDGKPDLSFAQKGYVSMTIAKGFTKGKAIALQADGKIVVTGETFTGYHLRDIILVRFGSDGFRDMTFGNNGVALISYSGHEFNAGNDVKIQQDGKILIAGETSPLYSAEFEDFLVVRCKDNGAIDETFGINGYSITDFGTDYDKATGLAIQPDGKIVVNGNSSYFTGLARYKNDSFNSFEPLSKLSSDIRAHHPNICVYPNPVKNTINIKGLDADSQSILTITNASGKVVSKAITSTPDYSMNADHLPAGFYVLNVYSKNKTLSLKFLKE